MPCVIYQVEAAKRMDMFHKKTWVGFTPGVFAAGHALGLLYEGSHGGSSHVCGWLHSATGGVCKGSTAFAANHAGGMLQLRRQQVVRRVSGQGRRERAPGVAAGPQLCVRSLLHYHIIAKVHPQAMRSCLVLTAGLARKSPPRHPDWPASGYAAASDLGIVCGYSLF